MRMSLLRMCVIRERGRERERYACILSVIWDVQYGAYYIRIAEE